MRLLVIHYRSMEHDIELGEKEKEVDAEKPFPWLYLLLVYVAFVLVIALVLYVGQLNDTRDGLKAPFFGLVLGIVLMSIALPFCIAWYCGIAAFYCGIAAIGWAFMCSICDRVYYFLMKRTERSLYGL